MEADRLKIRVIGIEYLDVRQNNIKSLKIIAELLFFTLAGQFDPDGGMIAGLLPAADLAVDTGDGQAMTNSRTK